MVRHGNTARLADSHVTWMPVSGHSYTHPGSPVGLLCANNSLTHLAALRRHAYCSAVLLALSLTSVLAPHFSRYCAVRGALAMQASISGVFPLRSLVYQSLSGGAPLVSRFRTRLSRPRRLFLLSSLARMSLWREKN